MTSAVVVDRFGTLYHNPDKLHTLVDMEVMDEQDAFDQGIIPCSQCFSRYYNKHGELTLNV